MGDGRVVGACVDEWRVCRWDGLAMLVVDADRCKGVLDELERDEIRGGMR